MMFSDWPVIAAFAKLQWRATRAAVKGGGRRAFAAVFTVIGSLGLGCVGLVVIPLLLRYSSPSPELTRVLIGGSVLLFVVTAGISTLVGVNNSLDVRVVATEPLARWQVALGQLAMEATGPTGIGMMLAGVGVVIGTAGDVWSVPLAVAAVVTLLIANMLVARVVINLLGLVVDRWPRVGQLISGLVGLLFMVGYQVAVNVVPRTPRSRLRSIADVFGGLPGGSIGRALGIAAEGGFGTLSAWWGVVWTAIWIPGLVWLFVRTTERLFDAASGLGRRTVRDRLRWRRWFGGGPAGTIAARSAMTAMRSPRRMIELTMGFAVGAASVVMPPILTDDVSRVVATGFGTCFAVILPLTNMFGTDGPAIMNELLAGATPDVVVAGKRRFAIAVGLPLVIIGPLVVAIVTGGWTLWPINLLLGIAGVLGGSAVAILQSSWAPFPVPENVNPFALGGSSGLLAAVTWFASLAGLFIVMAPMLIAVAVAVWFDLLWLALLGAVAAVGWAYGVTRLAGTFAATFVVRQDRLLDQITPAA